MKLGKRPAEKPSSTPEVLRDTSSLTAGQKRVGLASVCFLALGMGFAGGAVVWAVLRIMSLGIDVLWTRLPRLIGCEHSLAYYLIVCGIGGLLIGLMQRQVGPLPDNIEQVLGRVRKTGGYPYDRLHIIAVAALLPLIFGGALGPEAGLSGLVAGLCCWVGDRLKYSGDQVAALTETGLAVTLGVIFHAPLFGIAQNLEPDPGDPSEGYRTKIVKKRTRIIIYCFGVAGGMLAFALLGKLLGSGGGLPRFSVHHAIGLDQWKWFLPLAAAGILFSLFYQLVEQITRKLAGRLLDDGTGGDEACDGESHAPVGAGAHAADGGAGRDEACDGGDEACDGESHAPVGAGAASPGSVKMSWRPVIAAMIPAACMALCGWALPLTMFSGEHQLSELIEGWQTASPQELILSSVLKLALVSLCINFGWRGGSIFPIIFSGACIGYAFALIVGMDGAFAAAIVIAALYAYQMRKPVAVMMVLLLCFPVTYIIPVGVAAFLAAKIPSPFARVTGHAADD